MKFFEWVVGTLRVERGRESRLLDNVDRERDRERERNGEREAAFTSLGTDNVRT